MGFLRGFSIAMGANAIVFVLSFLNNKLIYVFLSPEDNGVYFLAMRYALLIALVFGGWLRLTFVNIAGQDKQTTSLLGANLLVYSASAALCLTAGIWIAGTWGAYDVSVLPPLFLTTVIVTGVSLLMRDGFQSLLLVNNRVMQYGITFILWGSIFIVLDILFILVFNMGLTGVFVALMSATAIAACWAIVWNIIFHGISSKPSAALFGRSLQLGTRAAIAVVGMFLMLNIHVFLLKSLVGDQYNGLVMLGLFSVCYRVYQLFQRGADVTATVLHATVSQQETTTGFRTTVLVSRNLLLGMLLLSFAAMLFGKSIIYIIADSEYLDAYQSLLIMLPGIALVTTGTALNSSYWARDYPWKVILAPFVATLAGVIMNVVLVPRYGVFGAALSFTGVGIAWFIYIILLFKRDTGYSLREILFPTMDDVQYLYGRISSKLPWRQI